jgi:methylphosphotriester-DNA--protein-cysteine methyltransferase
MPSSLNVNDLIINRSDRSDFAELSVAIHEFPANAPCAFTPARDAYTFWYRPRREKGGTRLNYARKLIAQGNRAPALAEIAAASGFCDQAHLNRHFRRFFGTTPSAFRSRAFTPVTD